MPLNAVVPIRPRNTEGTDFSNNYLQWLSRVGAYSDLSDAMIYRPVDNKVISPRGYNTATGEKGEGRLTEAAYGSKTLPKVAPHTKYIDVKDPGKYKKSNPGIEHKFSDTTYFHPVEKGGEFRGELRYQNGPWKTENFKHEAQHALLDKADYLNGQPQRTPYQFYDRKNNLPVSAEQYFPDDADTPVQRQGKIDLYQRSQDEWLANAAKWNENPLKPNEPEYSSIATKETPLAERVVTVRPRWMQAAPWVQAMKGMGSALGAVGSATGIIDTANQIDQNVQGYGGFKNWLTGRKAPAL